MHILVLRHGHLRVCFIKILIFDANQWKNVLSYHGMNNCNYYCDLVTVVGN